MKKLILNISFTLLLFPQFIFAQCNVTVSPVSATIDCGESIDLSAIGLSSLPALAEDFNTNSIGAGWLTTLPLIYDNPCGPSLDGTPSAWFGNVPLPKTLTTTGFDMSCGGQVCFDLDFGGDDAGDLNNCEDPDELDEGVFFQYSVNGGATWVDIFYFEPTDDISGPYYDWANYCFTLPPAAWSPNTMFQWDQPEVTSSVNDHWGIDNVVITPTDCGYWYNWDNIAGPVDNQSQTVSPLNTTTYNVVYTDGADSCDIDVIVTVNPLIIDATASPENLICDECTDLNMSLLNPPTNICQETASANGPDGSTDVTINGFACVGGGAIITQVSMDGSIGGNCPSWYTFDLVINGNTVQSGLCNTTNLDLTGYLPFSSVVLSANDNDAWSDNVTLNLTLNITYTTNPTYSYSWSPPQNIDDPNTQTPNACPNEDVTYTATLIETNSGCTAVDSVTVTYLCEGCDLTNTALSGDCNPATNTYIMTGTVTFTGAPIGGVLMIEVNNSSDDFDTIIHPPFTSGTNWSISGIPADGSNSTVTAFFTTEDSCSTFDEFIAPDPCVTCDSEVGTFSATITGNSINNYILCFGDQIDITTNNDWLGPNEQTNPPGPNYDPGVSWMIYSCPPSVGLVPNIINTVTDDPCFLTFVDAFNMTDINDLSWIEAFPQGTFTDNIIYWVPITMYSIDEGTLSYSNNELPCYNMGTPYAVQYLTDYNSSITEDCASGTATVTLTGSLPQIDGSYFTVSNLLPINASFSNTTIANNGTLNITGLTEGDMYSFTVIDDNGCPHLINSGPFPGAPEVSFSATPLSGCEPLEVEFTNTTNPEGQNCFWEFGDGSTAYGCGNVTNVYNQGLYDVTLTVTGDNGCTATTTYEEYINVYQQPVASFSYNPHQVDVGDTEVEFENSSLFANSYLWNYGDNSATSTEENPVHNYPDVAGNYAVTLIAYNDNMTCVDTVQQTVIVMDIIIFYVPNIFTPDYDDYNQVFYPIFTSGYDPYDFHMVIFNRWGEIVFESYDVNAGWNGHYGNGDLVQDGVYIWTIDFKESMSDKRHKHTGHVTLLK